MSIPEHILNSECPHRLLYMNCGEVECNNYLRGIEEAGVVDNSAEAWEEDWNDSPQLGGMGEELRQEYGEREDEGHCLATFCEDPMPDTVYCQENGRHTRHTSGGGNDYYAWLDGDEGAGWDPLQ